MTKEDVLTYLRTNKSSFEQQFGVIRIGLFGSYARDNAGKDSDLDLAIEMQPDKKSMKNFLGFKRHLEAYFGKRVDLGIESALKPLVREQVRKEVIYV